MEKGSNCSSGAISPLTHNNCYLMLDVYVKTRIRFSLRDKRLFEITEVEITRVDCTTNLMILRDVLHQHTTNNMILRDGIHLYLYNLFA